MRNSPPLPFESYLLPARPTAEEHRKDSRLEIEGTKHMLVVDHLEKAASLMVEVEPAGLALLAEVHDCTS